MKLLRTYSTSKNNSGNYDVLLDVSKTGMISLGTYFCNKDEHFVISINLENGKLCELHDDVELVRKRVTEILFCFGYDLQDADKFSQEMKFLKC